MVSTGLLSLWLAAAKSTFNLDSEAMLTGRVVEGFLSGQVEAKLSPTYLQRGKQTSPTNRLIGLTPSTQMQFGPREAILWTLILFKTLVAS